MRKATSKAVLMFFVFAIFLFVFLVENFAVVTHETQTTNIQINMEHEGAYCKAADINYDNEISITDLAKIKLVLIEREILR